MAEADGKTDHKKPLQNCPPIVPYFHNPSVRLLVLFPKEPESTASIHLNEAILSSSQGGDSEEKKVWWDLCPEEVGMLPGN